MFAHFKLITKIDS